MFSQARQSCTGNCQVLCWLWTTVLRTHLVSFTEWGDNVCRANQTHRILLCSLEYGRNVAVGLAEGKSALYQSSAHRLDRCFMIQKGTSRVNPFVKMYTHCSPTVRQQSITQAGPDNVPCIYVLDAMSITKANAFEQIVTDVNSIGADIIILTETWLKEKHADDAVTISGYICLRNDRVKRGGGGVAAFVKQDLQPTCINAQSTMQHTRICGLLWPLQQGCNFCVINFCACYHPPRPIYDSSEFIRHLSSSIEFILETDLDTIFVLTGDLNRLDTTEIQTQQGLDQIVNLPTDNNNILDQFLTNRPDLFTVQVVQSLVKTKHKALIINSKLDCAKAVQRPSVLQLNCLTIHR